MRIGQPSSVKSKRPLQAAALIIIFLLGLFLGGSYSADLQNLFDRQRPPEVNAPPLQLVTLDLPFSSYEEIRQQATAALQSDEGIWISSELDDQSGSLRMADRNIPINIRVPSTTRIERDSIPKWSLLIEIGPGQPWIWPGITQYLLLDPQTIGGLNGWAYAQFLQAENIDTAPITFVNLSINGEPSQIYAVTAADPQEVIWTKTDSGQPVIHLDTNAKWARAAAFDGDLSAAQQDPYSHFDLQQWAAFPPAQPSSAITQNSDWLAAYNMATASFDLAANAPIETEAFATAAALADLWQSADSLNADHLVFWQSTQDTQFRPYVSITPPFTQRITLDKVAAGRSDMVAAITTASGRISSPDYINDRMADIITKPEYWSYLNALQSEYPTTQPPWDQLLDAQSLIRHSLAANDQYTIDLADLPDDNSTLQFEVSNQTAQTLRFVAVVITDQDGQSATLQLNEMGWEPADQPGSLSPQSAATIVIPLTAIYNTNEALSFKQAPQIELVLGDR